MDNLININNGESKNVVFETGNVTTEPGIKVLFKQPFAHKCLLVLTIDNTGVPAIYQQLESWDKLGFTIKSIQISNGATYTLPDYYFYLAIGF